MSFNLDKDENVVYEARRNWFYVWARSVTVFFSILVPIVLFAIFKSVDFIKIEGNSDALFMILILVWFFVAWNIIFIFWTNHFLDILVITNKHLIDIEQKGIFSREVSVIQLSKIQDITTDVNGFIPTIMSFGDLSIQSAGSHTRFVIKDLDNPDFVRSKIKQAISGEVPVDKQ